MIFLIFFQRIKKTIQLNILILLHFCVHLFLNIMRQKPEKRVGLNREVEKWAFGELNNYDEISIIEMNIHDEPGELPSFIRKSEEEKKKEEEKEKEKKKKNQEKGLNKKGNNTMSRSLPGALQKNVTTERKYFKELLQLSQQRYIELNTIEFQKNNFIARQANKGILVNDVVR